MSDRIKLQPNETWMISVQHIVRIVPSHPGTLIFMSNGETYSIDRSYEEIRGLVMAGNDWIRGRG